MNYCLEVTGDLACFTRPEMKVERVSYDVITPSAARAIFEAILWKPAIRWQIDKIEVMNPIRWLSIRRNEVGSKMSTRNAQSLMNGTSDDYAIYVDEDRQQRAALLLKDVRYRIHAHFEMTDRAGPQDQATKFAEMFRRRARKGQCMYQPYLGCREFSGDVRLLDHLPDTAPQAIDQDLGFMLYDLDFSKPAHLRPMFFRAVLQQGVLWVPPLGSQEIRT
jgi:CRISPR-associated protein Cas5d